MPTITRRIRTVSLKVMSARFLSFPSRRTGASGRLPFRRASSVILCLRPWSKTARLCYCCTLAVVVAEPASISFWTLSFCFPLTAFSWFPFSTDMFPFTRFHQYSCFNSFISGLKNFVSWSFDLFCLFTMVFNFWQLGFERCWLISCSYVANTVWSWSDPSYSHIFYKLFRILSLRTSLADNWAWSHLVSKSWKSSPCKVTLNRSVKSENRFMCSSLRKVFGDYIRNLSSTEKAVFRLGLVLLQTAFLLEVEGSWWSSARRTLSSHQASQSSKNLMVSNWSRRLKIVRWSDHLHFFDPQHSLRGKVWTYLGLETSFQNTGM